MKAIAGQLEKLFNRNDDNPRSDVSSGQSCTLSDYEDYIEDSQSCYSFEEAMAMMLSISNDIEMPKNLQGSILLDQTYAVPSTDHNL
ncbi:hypothetical protein RHMOL_Rhmol08G0244700 [Rhododendron molle]|uniref:Uncharacterized protein n=1 Tax=Rhododendron molle TaxID=49168 RepID=A0ACC0MTG6_RHOML|nr:hypothetical protein RHMOL_Rhmol08G0244700 [Rhododendron molle]